MGTDAAQQLQHAFRKDKAGNQRPGYTLAGNESRKVHS